MHISNERAELLREVAARLDLEDCSLDYLNQAFCHSSYINENGMAHHEGNERLEFLGDAVLGVIITEYLYRTYLDSDEGHLSKVKSLVVSRRILARYARKQSFGDYLALGRGEETSGGRKRESILADTFESLVGAVYLSCGLESARAFVLRQLKAEIDSAANDESIKDPKSYLQEFAQRDHNQIPKYRVVRTEGPDHDKRFEVEVCLHNAVIARGAGRSKKSAEQSAALNAIEVITARDSGAA